MKKTRINLNDYSRMLLSETSPFDVPIIFTNNWFYKKIRHKDKKTESIKSVVEYLFERKDHTEVSIPMRYKIRKGDKSYRHMGLLHPAQQINMLEFYKVYSSQILHYCSKSSFSIRRPAKVASSFFIPNRLQDSRVLRENTAQRLSDENKFKHATSYFSYDRYSKLHQFFEDEEFFDLEEKYTDFWSIDVSKCFDSIYTHSVSWATKGKFRSKTSKVKDTFGAVFDLLMQRSNFNETNGIVIGNEVSRIFSEIILQGIDCNVKASLKGNSLVEGFDYDVRRYVDDYFIFASSPDICQKVLNSIEDNLRAYKLFINQQKTNKVQKPFITSITKSKLETSKALSELYDILFEVNEHGFSVVNGKSIRKTYSVVKSFVNKVKAPCYNDKKAYDVMTGYVISALTNKLKDINNSHPNLINKEGFLLYRDVFIVMLKIAFHLFNVNPSFNNSVKISMLSYISYGFFERYFPEEERTIKLLINSYIKNFFDSGKCKHLLSNNEIYFPIEFTNLLFVSRNMGSDYLLSRNQISSIFDLNGLKKRRDKFICQEENFDYFQLMSLLYYIGNEPEYDIIKKDVVKELKGRLSDLGGVTKDAKVCYLLLDSISCPYIDSKIRKEWSLRLYKNIHPKARNTTSQDYDKFFNEISSEEWFISWNYLDLWNTLEKKELHFDY